jgi:hypothetical protein
MLYHLVKAKDFPELLLRLLDPVERYENFDDQLILLLRNIPIEGLLGIKEKIVILCKKLPQDWVLIAACIEAFTVAGAWEVAAEITKNCYENVDDSIRMHKRKQYEQLKMLATEFEQQLAIGSSANSLRCANFWRLTFNKLKFDKGDK